MSIKIPLALEEASGYIKGILVGLAAGLDIKYEHYEVLVYYMVCERYKVKKLMVIIIVMNKKPLAVKPHQTIQMLDQYHTPILFAKT